MRQSVKRVSRRGTSRKKWLGRNRNCANRAHARLGESCQERPFSVSRWILDVVVLVIVSEIPLREIRIVRFRCYNTISSSCQSHHKFKLHKTSTEELSTAVFSRLLQASLQQLLTTSMLREVEIRHVGRGFEKAPQKFAVVRRHRKQNSSSITIVGCILCTFDNLFFFVLCFDSTIEQEQLQFTVLL